MRNKRVYKTVSLAGTSSRFRLAGSWALIRQFVIPSPEGQLPITASSRLHKFQLTGPAGFTYC